jgi:transposase-like protein
MYPYDDRIRAVSLYIKLGLRLAATLRQLGYPTKNALKLWHREFEKQLDLPVGYERAKPKYSLEQKQMAVEHYLEHGSCISVTIKTLGYLGRVSLLGLKN